MHAFQSGILMYLVKMTIDTLSTKRQVALDRLVHKLFHGLRCKEKKEYPRLNFSKGFSKLTMLTSDEWAGKLFVLLLVLHTDEGKEILDHKTVFDPNNVKLPESFNTDQPKDKQASDLEEFAKELDAQREGASAEAEATVPKSKEEEEEALKNNKKKKKRHDEEPEEMLRKCSLNDFTELAESLLCFHAWYKLGSNPLTKDGKVNTKMIQSSISRMLAMVRWFTPRKKGNGWKLQKFHDILHLAVDIERFGPPSNFDAGPHESGLRFWAKLPALTSQKRGYNLFAMQVAARTYEYQCFAKAMRANGILGFRDRHLKGIIEGTTVREDDAMGEKNREPMLLGSQYRVYNSAPDGDDPTSYFGNVFQPTVRLYRCGMREGVKDTSLCIHWWRTFSGGRLSHKKCLCCQSRSVGKYFGIVALNVP